MTLSAAARILQGKLSGSDTEFVGVGSDTRKLARGELFVALVGPNFDGHDFLGEAARANAAGALVSRVTDTTMSTVIVPDTRLALGALAEHWRGQFALPLIAVTGSNGKTTVKGMLASIMGETGAGIATQGNLNNDIGVPLTLLRLRKGDRYAVIEMGMNHPGEIDYLTRLAQPTIALITNAAEAHLAGLGTVEAVARAKGEIFAGLGDNGIAVINADDRYAPYWRNLAGARRQVSFGLKAKADVGAEYGLDATGSAMRLKTPQGQTDVRLALLGRHNIMNALAAAAASLAAGVTLDHIKNGLEKLRPTAGRLELIPGFNGARVLDDTYNANPASLAAGMEVLKDAGGERVLVIGDMAELGDGGPEIHRRMGELARSMGIDRLYAIGELARLTAKGFGAGAVHADRHDSLVNELRNVMHGNMTILVKGSRVMRMEQVVRGISRNGEVSTDRSKDAQSSAASMIGGRGI